MLFHIVAAENEVRQAGAPGAYLVHDNWNDWRKFKTMYTLYVVITPGVYRNVGSVKIGEKGMTDATVSPDLPEHFDYLGDQFFSIGQDEDYYQTINQLEGFRDQIYAGLRDCAFSQEIFSESLSEYIMGESLLRSLSTQSVRGRLHRLAHGNAELTHFGFVYSIPSDVIAGDTELRFDVSPSSTPSTNVHVLIGKNGVGKTRCLSGMIGAMTKTRARRTCANSGHAFYFLMISKGLRYRSRIARVAYRRQKWWFGLFRPPIQAFWEMAMAALDVAEDMPRSK